MINPLVKLFLLWKEDRVMPCSQTTVGCLRIRVLKIVRFSIIVPLESRFVLSSLSNSDTELFDKRRITSALLE